ncbi:MAG: AAA family ATPase, partial [Endomicrobium sp.]|nr:AAA family ATPase [Endomicrobium sp.]
SLLESSLLDFVNSTADKYGVELSSTTLPSRFAQLIEQLHKKAGSPVAVLIDEYDKPLIDNIDRETYSHPKGIWKREYRNDSVAISNGVSDNKGKGNNGWHPTI